MTGKVFLAIAALFVVAAALGGCATNPVTGQTELRLVGREQEISIGRNVDAEIRREYKVVTGTVAANRVERIGRKIASVCERSDVEYHFALLESDELNAFAAPGGFIYVTTTTEKVADSDAELAAVIGHEVGHVAMYHSVKQIQSALAFDILNSLILGDKEQSAEAAAIAFNVVIMSGFSREHERESDRLGVIYPWKAGYDPYGMAGFLAKLEERNAETVVDKTFEFMRSHPLISQRRQAAEELAREMAARGVR